MKENKPQHKPPTSTRPLGHPCVYPPTWPVWAWAAFGALHSGVPYPSPCPPEGIPGHAFCRLPCWPCTFFQVLFSIWLNLQSETILSGDKDLTHLPRYFRKQLRGLCHQAVRESPPPPGGQACHTGWLLSAFISSRKKRAFPCIHLLRNNQAFRESRAGPPRCVCSAAHGPGVQ